MGNNQYPKTVDLAMDILSQHKWDNTKELRKQGQDQQVKNKDKKKDSSYASVASYAQKNIKDVTCHCCGKKGHYAPACPYRDTIERKDWWVKKNHAQQAEASESQAEEDDSSVGNRVLVKVDRPK